MIDIGAIPGVRATVTVRTYTSPAIDGYGEVSETATDTTVVVSWHPGASRRTLERVPEADRQRQFVSIYSDAAIPLRARILLHSEWYEVIRCADYTHIGGPYLQEAALIE